MAIGTLKSSNRSCWADLQFVGLKSSGIPASNKTMLHGGKVTEQIGGDPFTGQIVLLVNHSGLSNKLAPLDVKQLFREKVMPVLAMTDPEVSRRNAVRIELHYFEGTLQKAKYN